MLTHFRRLRSVVESSVFEVKSAVETIVVPDLNPIASSYCNLKERLTDILRELLSSQLK
jgi:hypothetical protein